MNPKETILEEAARIVNGDRAQDYGDSNEMLKRIAALWMPVLRDCVWDEGEVPGANIELYIEPRHVALCLIQLKVAREINSPKRDNAVDIAGYAELLGRVEDERGAGYGSEQNFGGSPEPMGLEEFRKAVWGVHNRPADLSCIAAFNSYLNQLATVAGWSKLVTDCPPQDRGMFIDHITVAAGLIDGGYSPETTDYLGEGNGFETRWVFSSKTDPQNEKTDSENPKCEATEAKSEATPKFKPGDRAMLEGAEVEVLGRPNSAYASSRPLERWVIRHLSSESGRRKGLRIIVNENHLQSIPTKTDSATPEPPAAEAKPEDAPYSALAEYFKASVYASANTLPRTVGKYPVLGAGYELGEGGIEALWRKLGKFTWVVVKDGVKPYEDYGHGVVKDIVSCTETTGTSTTGEGLRKIVKAVVEFPPSSLPNNAALPQTCTIPVEHLSITIARRDYRKP